LNTIAYEKDLIKGEIKKINKKKDFF
jgi:hypothetical protein